LTSSDQREGERVPTFLRVRLKFADVDAFIEKYSTNVSLGGIFIQSRSPKPPGTVLRFEMALQSGEPLIRGEGQVTWVKEFDPNTPGQPFGMGVRFTQLDPRSRSIVERAVAHRQNRTPAGGPDRGFNTSPPTPKGKAPAAPMGRPTNGPADLERLDAELAGLMREAGLNDEQIALAAVRAADVARTAEGTLAALLRPAPRPAGSPPPMPAQTDRPASATPPPSAGAAESHPPIPPPQSTEEPLPIDGDPPPAPARKGRGKRRSLATPEPTPDPVVELSEPEDSAPIEVSPPEAASPASPPEELQAPPEAFFDSEDLEGADLVLESLQVPEPSEQGARELPAEAVDEDQPEVALQPVDGDQPEVALEVVDGDQPEVALEAEGGEQPEITAVGAPPTFADTPDEEPDLFPEQEVTTPLPEEATTPLFAGETATPAEPAPEPEKPETAPESAADRWAAATGPETANLEAELVAAMDSVIDPTPTGDKKRPPKRRSGKSGRATGARDAQKGKKGILGRIFKKK